LLREAKPLRKVSGFASRGNYGVVVHGGDGLDEVTTTTSSMVWVSGDGEVERMELDLLNVGVPRASIGDLVGGDAEVVREVVFGQSDPIRDIVVLNAAAAWSRMANRLFDFERGWSRSCC
jgi:anthranilate phosphoribosyltransferase